MKYYYVICQSHETPDGPATLIGPYDYDGALMDIYNATIYGMKESGSRCKRKHLIGWWNEPLPPSDNVISGLQCNDKLIAAFNDGGREEVFAMITNHKADKDKYVYHEMRNHEAV